MFYVFCGFSYRSKVIIKGVYNIREVGYGIIKTKGVYSWYTGCYSFYNNCNEKRVYFTS